MPQKGHFERIREVYCGNYIFFRYTSLLLG